MLTEQRIASLANLLKQGYDAHAPEVGFTKEAFIEKFTEAAKLSWAHCYEVLEEYGSQVIPEDSIYWLVADLICKLQDLD